MKVQRNKNRGQNMAPMHSGGWQIVYTGFILILLTFFIMLTSFASLEQSKITRFVQAFSDAVNVFSGGQSLEEGKTMINTGAVMVDKEDAMAKLFEKVRMLGQQNNLQQLDIQRTQRGVIMTVSDQLLFSSGQAIISSRAYPLLNKIAGIIGAIKTPVEIEGHTDNVPIHTPVFDSNWELSTARAVNVLRYMTTRGGVDPQWVSAVGMAEYQPVAPNTTAIDRAKNRRVEIVFKVN
jgi:chemotaxis protein MotB